MDKQKKIHVLYILTKLELGGAQKVCLTLLDGLVKNGNMSSLVSGSQGILTDQAKKHSSAFFIDGFKREVSLKGLWCEFKTFIDMIRLIKKIKTSTTDIIVHTHSTKAGILGRWAAFFAGVKIRIHTVHGFGFNNYQKFYVWLIIYGLELLTSLVTTHYICVSQSDLELGCKKILNFKKKSSLIRAAVETKEFVFYPATKNFSSDEITIGTVSCFKPQKNLFDLLNAFKFICMTNNKKTLHLQIIGDGTMRPQIEQWIRQNNMHEQIELVGWQRNVPMWMKQWDIFAMSSLWEGLPMSVVEARLSKLPIVAYDVGGIYEIVKNDQNGFIVKPGDWQTLANKLALLIENNELRKKLSLFNDSLNDFDNHFMVQKHIQLYKQLINDRR